MSAAQLPADVRAALVSLRRSHDERVAHLIRVDSSRLFYFAPHLRRENGGAAR